MAENSTMLGAPIPGMSLTSELGNRPWEAPPNMVTVEEALEFYTKNILGNSDAHDDILEALEGGVPIRNLANMINKSAVMDGKHTLDVGFLVLPAIEELLMAVADTYDVSYMRSVEDEAKKRLISPRQARLIFEETKKAKSKTEEEDDMATAQEPRSKGLMAKPSAANEAPMDMEE